MNRRQVALTLATAPLFASSARAAEPVEGQNYVKLSQPVAVAVPGKIEVIEFFGYWCPHCNALEPALEAWVKKLPADVNFRRLPAGWAPFHEPYKKLFFGLEAMGAGSEVHAKVFNAVHVQHLKLENEDVLLKFAKDSGIDGPKLVSTMNSFSIGPKLAMSKQLFSAYRAEGVPTIGVHGRYVTGPERWPGDAALFAGLDALIAKARSGK